MKLNRILLIIFCMFLSLNTAFSADLPVAPDKKETKAVINDEKSGIDEKTQTLIEKIGFGKFVDSNSTSEIETFFKAFEKYNKKGDIEKLKTLYADDFVNNDGFTKKTYFDLIYLVEDMYEDVDYSIELTSVSRNGDYAYAFIHEVASAKTTEQYNEKTGTGIIKSDSNYLYNLRKIGGKWKICAMDTLNEVTSLVYGDAKGLEFDIKAPTKVLAGSNYAVDFEVKNMPKDAVLIASITNDPIIYPQVNREDVFRTFKKSKNLERILTANTDNYNEYATVSLGITKAGIIKNGDDVNMVKIYMTGMAFIMSRVNVQSVINHKVEKKPKEKDGQAEK